MTFLSISRWFVWTLVSSRNAVTCAPSSTCMHVFLNLHSHSLSFSIQNFTNAWNKTDLSRVCMCVQVSFVSALTGCSVFPSLMFCLDDALQVPWNALGKNGWVLFNVRNMWQLQSLRVGHRVGEKTGKQSTLELRLVVVWRIHIYMYVHITLFLEQTWCHMYFFGCTQVRTIYYLLSNSG